MLSTEEAGGEASHRDRADEAFILFAQKMGLARPDQIEKARQTQASRAANGVAITLADALVQMGIITEQQREDAQERLAASSTSGPNQFGHYRLERLLGQGAMGSVYLAQDTLMRRAVAVKVLNEQKFADSRAFSRFKQEVRAAGKLNHPNIITAYSVGEEAGIFYLVMEYCDGRSLDAILKDRTRIPADEALLIALGVARGLAYAHSHGLIHRDIKPANIFVCADTNVKILDLGLAKDVSDSNRSFNTQTGMALGTPHYISPEQARGQKQIDGKTDIYSLGATLFHLLTGETAFHGDTVAVVLMNHMTREIPDVRNCCPELPDPLAQLIRGMTAFDPAARYRDCVEVCADIERLIAGKRLLGPKAHARASLESGALSRWQKQALVAIAIVLLLVLVLDPFSWTRSERRSPAGPAASLTAQTSVSNAQAQGTLPAPVEHVAARVFLSDLPVSVGRTIDAGSQFYRAWSFGKGRFGADANGQPIRVGGVLSPHGLGMNAPGPNDAARVSYRLDIKYVSLETAAAINDSAAGPGRAGSATPLTFKLLGDGRELWTSRPLQRAGDSQPCVVDVSSVNTLELVVDCRGDWWFAQGVWFEPRLTPK